MDRAHGPGRPACQPLGLAGSVHADRDVRGEERRRELFEPTLRPRVRVHRQMLERDDTHAPRQQRGENRVPTRRGGDQVRLEDVGPQRMHRPPLRCDRREIPLAADRGYQRRRCAFALAGYPLDHVARDAHHDDLHARRELAQVRGDTRFGSADELRVAEDRESKRRQVVVCLRFPHRS